uniref:Tankyrase 1-binding protein C-terminal domain-containing protein n=1 Tax=Stegastes partitus TaxID=144197 RepID=A0A3B5A7T3_9TELE
SEPDQQDGVYTKESSLKQRESDSEEDQPTPKTVSSLPPTSQRVPVFPGLSPAALLVSSLKEKETVNEEAAPSPSQLSRSPRSAAHLAGAARVLPPIGGKDGGAVSSPAWLKELKSKKRMSQHGDS